VSLAIAARDEAKTEKSLMDRLRSSYWNEWRKLTEYYLFATSKGFMFGLSSQRRDPICLIQFDRGNHKLFRLQMVSHPFQSH
jgi:hypothetical protein